MRIILLRDVKGVGRKFDEKNVSDGYALNMLIPKKLAVSVSGQGAAMVKELKKQEEEHRAKDAQRLHDSLSKIAGTTISIKMKANELGHLFSGINAEKLSKLLKSEEGLDLAPESIELAETIKEIGTFEVPISISNGTVSKFTLVIERS